MAHKISKLTSVLLWLLPLWAVLLFISTLTEQPDPQTAFADFAVYVTTSQFLISHLLGSIVGAAIGSIGVIGLMLYLQDTRVAGRMITGMSATVVGNMLMSAVYGVAAFAQPAMGRLYLTGQQNAVEFYNQSYTAPLFGTALFGMLLFIIGGVFSGMSISGSGRFPRWVGWVYAVAATAFAFGLFFPPIVMNVASVLLFFAALAVAWSAGRGAGAQNVKVAKAS